MGFPGYVVNPDGSKIFVEDKWAYFHQHPESYFSTKASIENLQSFRKRAHAVPEAPVKNYGAEAMPTKDVGFDHWCIRGRTVRMCEKCNGVTPKVNGKSKSCNACDNTGRVFEACKQCAAIPNAVANTLNGVAGVSA